MSRLLHIYWHKDNEAENIHSWTAILKNGVCTVHDALVPDTRPNTWNYTSEYEMINRLKTDFDVNKGYQIVDKGSLPVETFTQELNGKKIAYHSETEFLIQVGRHASSYKTRYTITGNLAQAVMYFNGINIGNGYKKRLIAPGMNKPVLARVTS